MVKWLGLSAGKSTPLHANGLDSISISRGIIVTGGKDGLIFLLDGTSLNKRQTFDLNSNQYSSVCSQIRSAILSDDDSKLLVGTYGSEIFEIDLSSGQGQNFIRGHYTPSRNKTVTNEV